MGLSQSLYTGWLGMHTHQRALDNTSNNLANVNTVGYKRTDHQFSNVMSKIIHGGYGADGDRSTVNPQAVGLGVTTGAIQHQFNQGSVDITNRNLDVMITGNGFFVVGTPTGTALTRDGSFYISAEDAANQRNLLVGNGNHVMGWNAVNGVVTPGAAVENITVPALGDMMAGEVTQNVNFNGNLPTNVSGNAFNGSLTSHIDFKGNLTANGENTIRTEISASVNSSGGSNPVNGEIQSIPVEITFTGPTISDDGATQNYNWVMQTVDWPNPGDPPVQIYPPPDNPEYTQGVIQFYNNDDPARGRLAGMPVEDFFRPGSTNVSTSYVDENGNTVTTSFDLTNNLQLAVSRLTALEGSAPGGDDLKIWSTNGNPRGSMSRTITIFDEYTEFIESTDADGNRVVTAERRVGERDVTMNFTRGERTNTGTEWEWNSPTDGRSGTLQFNTLGDLVSATGTEGPPEYSFTDVTYTSLAGAFGIESQDGYVDGFLEDITIDPFGRVQGRYDNDQTEILAQIAMGNVPNPEGMNATAGTLFYPNSSSGALMIGTAGSNSSDLPGIGAGTLQSGRLEGSNVELTREFTGLISIERGYQLTARVVTTADEMLQQLVSMKR